MPMRVGDTPEGDAGTAPTPAPGAGEAPPAAESEDDKKKKAGKEDLVDDATTAAAAGCFVLECMDCFSIMTLGAAATAALVWRSRRKRRLASV